MKLLSFVFFCSLIAHAVPSAAAPANAAKERAVISAGRSTEWKVPAGVAISVSDGSVVRAADFGQHLKITGKKQGVAVVRAGSRELMVHVLSPADHRLFSSLENVLVDRRGLQLDVDNKQILLTGRLLRFEDWTELAAAADQTGAEYTFAASLGPELRAKADAKFRALLREARLPELAIRLEDRATVTVPTEPADLKASVARVLARYGVRVESSASALSLEPLVRVKMVVAEVRRSEARTFGVKWPSEYAAQLLPRFDASQPLGVSLQALEQNGMAKVLASPTLLCRSGKDAEFLAGGEFPVKIAGRKTAEVIWKKYGVLLKIHPRADFSGRMSIGIETEVSMIDASTSIDGIPGLLTNRLQSHFDLASPRTIVLSGLIKKESGESVKGLPGLSRLPVLGPLFSSEDFHDQRTELIVFVTPELDRGEP